jgi:hypothetical protein
MIIDEVLAHCIHASRRHDAANQFSKVLNNILLGNQRPDSLPAGSAAHFWCPRQDSCPWR